MLLATDPHPDMAALQLQPTSPPPFPPLRFRLGILLLLCVGHGSRILTSVEGFQEPVGRCWKGSHETLALIIARVGFANLARFRPGSGDRHGAGNGRCRDQITQGGKFTVERWKSRSKPMIGVDLMDTRVTDAELKCTPTIDVYLRI